MAIRRGSMACICIGKSDFPNRSEALPVTLSPINLTEVLRGKVYWDQGKVTPSLFGLEDQRISIEAIVKAAKLALDKMSSQQKDRAVCHIDSPEWRTWSNPETLLSDKGIRPDEVTEELRTAILKLLNASLAPEGYEKATSAMRINGFLGELVEAPTVMNEFSYNFALFGVEPSTTEPWGFLFYGHYLCLNAFFYTRQLVLSLWFTGAEPNLIEGGKYRGTRILEREEILCL
ncbi:hypothetical protein FOYG_17242 [Fusarium oxysporum NRRL 32931]|uniref:Uncharacterized protein n=1 Tax=Fusarium oxysporum NRRL 32931 TaxID=660029 RepID=W9HBI7_FUSOX|nr:hypothetical protein FOYG_17242 [Fusarium oxysporum NRRL 32931]